MEPTIPFHVKSCRDRLWTMMAVILTTDAVCGTVMLISRNELTHGDIVVIAVLLFFTIGTPLAILLDVITKRTKQSHKIKFRYAELYHMNDICSICLELMDKKAIQLDCKHGFHKRCIQQWVHKYKRECPVCRFQLLPLIEQTAPLDVQDVNITFIEQGKIKIGEISIV